jgi:hypothetical protein
MTGRSKIKISSEDFRVNPGSEFKLSDRRTDIKPICKSKKQYKKLLDEHVAALSSLQHLHYASNRYALLLIFQGMDAAGKDGAIRHVMSGINPQGCDVASFKQPSGNAQPAGSPNAGGSGSSTGRITRRCWSSGSIRSFWTVRASQQTCTTTSTSGASDTSRSSIWSTICISIQPAP